MNVGNLIFIYHRSGDLYMTCRLIFDEITGFFEFVDIHTELTYDRRWYRLTDDESTEHIDN